MGKGFSHQSYGMRKRVRVLLNLEDKRAEMLCWATLKRISDQDCDQQTRTPEASRGIYLRLTKRFQVPLQRQH